MAYSKVLIIDLNNMAYRALHTFSLSHKGVDVSVLYGTMRMMYKLVTTYKPDAVLACFDNGVPLHRRALIPEYKRGRHKDSDINWDRVYEQIDHLRFMAFPLHGIMSAAWHRTEADDLMYHAARLLICEHVYIVTADKDLLQAVNARTSIINPSKKNGLVISADNFEHLIDVPPELYLYYKVLIGDGSDNIPGVKSIGHKTALRMLHRHGKWIPDPLCIHPHTYNLSVLSVRQRAAFDNVGPDGLQDMYACMDLTYDMCGAHKALYDAPWSKAHTKHLRRWLQSYAFASLLEEGGKYTGVFGRLQRPVFDNYARHPVPYI